MSDVERARALVAQSAEWIDSAGAGNGYHPQMRVALLIAAAGLALRWGLLTPLGGEAGRGLAGRVAPEPLVAAFDSAIRAALEDAPAR